MMAWYIVLTENEGKLLVAYSVEKNDTCDGRLLYDKNTKEFKILQQCTDEQPHGMYGPIRARLASGKYQIGKKHFVAIG